MSRILEFQPTDEQTIVARVLLELHQAIDTHFPDAAGTSRQFTKTVLSSNSESTAINSAPSEGKKTATRVNAEVNSAEKVRRDDPQRKSQKHKAHPPKKDLAPTSSLEFSRREDSFAGKLHATALTEQAWSRWFTRFLLLTLFAGGVTLAWIYLFGPPKF